MKTSSAWLFLSPLILQKMKEDNMSQLADYDVLFCEQQYTHGSCYISLFNFESFDQFNTLKLPQILDIRELKQTDAAAKRRRSRSKFLFRRTQGQVNSVGP